MASNFEALEPPKCYVSVGGAGLDTGSWFFSQRVAIPNGTNKCFTLARSSTPPTDTYMVYLGVRGAGTDSNGFPTCGRRIASMLPSGSIGPLAGLSLAQPAIT